MSLEIADQRIRYLFIRMAGKQHIFLIGFSGSGKSTVGPLLADRLGISFVDTDSLIEKQAGCAISEIFQDQGERTFRRMEREAVETHVKRRKPAVIALGGGAFENPVIRKLALSSGLVVYLSCSAREIYHRLRNTKDRPLLDKVLRLRKTTRQVWLDRVGLLLKKRLTNYRKADLIISTTDKSPKQAAVQLYHLIGGKHENHQSKSR